MNEWLDKSEIANVDSNLLRRIRLLLNCEANYNLLAPENALQSAVKTYMNYTVRRIN